MYETNMIDYEKLNLAHELCKSTSGYYFDITLGMENGLIVLYDANKDDQLVSDDFTLDSLIEYVQELTQPKPKYKIGSTVWFSGRRFELKECIVRSYNEITTYYLITDDDNLKLRAYENELHSTKSALIQAQCDYWNKQKLEHETKFDCPPRFCSGTYK